GRMFFYKEPGWYRRLFQARAVEGKRYFLYFGAVNYEAAVYLNGQKLGEHKGGFTPFQFEVTGQLKTGDNSVVVRVNNTRKVEEVPTLNTDWWNYGGITRDVDLVEVPAVFIRDYALQLHPAAPDRLKGYVRVDGATGPVPVSVSVAGLTKVVTTDARGWAAIDLAAPRLDRWPPEHPTLYDAP